MALGPGSSYQVIKADLESAKRPNTEMTGELLSTPYAPQQVLCVSKYPS